MRVTKRWTPHVWWMSAVSPGRHCMTQLLRVVFRLEIEVSIFTVLFLWWVGVSPPSHAASVIFLYHILGMIGYLILYVLHIIWGKFCLTLTFQNSIALLAKSNGTACFCESFKQLGEISKTACYTDTDRLVQLLIPSLNRTKLGSILFFPPYSSVPMTATNGVTLTHLKCFTLHYDCEDVLWVLVHRFCVCRPCCFIALPWWGRCLW